MKKYTSSMRQKTDKELIKEADQLRREIAKITLDLKTNSIKDTNLLHKKKKMLAAILTLLQERRLAVKVG